MNIDGTDRKQLTYKLIAATGVHVVSIFYIPIREENGRHIRSN